MREIIGKMPPQAIEAESAVLGAILLEKDKLHEVLSIIQAPEAFYSLKNQKVYAAIQEVHASGLPVDLITVTQHLFKTDKDMPFYLTELTNGVVTSAHAEAHARIVQEKFIARELIRICGEVTAKAYDDSVDVFDLADYASEKIFEAKLVKNTDDWKSISQVAIELTHHMDEVKIQPPGISTGFTKLDEQNSRFQPGDFAIIGARPSMGKSALMLVMVRAAAMQRKVAGVISLEMMNKSLFARMVGMESGTPYKQVYFNYLEETRLKNVLGVMDKLAGLPVYFSDTARVDANDIAAKAYKLKRKHGLDILFIDYLQLIEGEKNKIRYEVVSQISRGLKTLALQLQIPIVALAQLNREGEANKRKPRMSDLRDSGSIEQDADIVALLHRDWRSGILNNPDGSSTEHEADLIIEKWRNDEPVSLKLHFDGPTMKFSEKAPESNFSDPYAGMRPMTDEEKTGTSYQTDYQTDYKSKAAGEKEDLDAPF